MSSPRSHSGRLVDDVRAYTDSIAGPVGLVGWSAGANLALLAAGGAPPDAVQAVAPQIPLPVAGHGPVLGLGRMVADVDHVGDLTHGLGLEPIGTAEVRCSRPPEGLAPTGRPRAAGAGC